MKTLEQHDNCPLGSFYKITIIDASVKHTSRGNASLYGDHWSIIFKEVRSNNNKSNASFITKFWNDYVYNSNFIPSVSQSQNDIFQELFGSITKGTWVDGNNDSFVMYSSCADSSYYIAMKNNINQGASMCNVNHPVGTRVLTSRLASFWHKFHDRYKLPSCYWIPFVNITRIFIFIIIIIIFITTPLFVILRRVLVMYRHGNIQTRLQYSTRLYFDVLYSVYAT
jgi:hypothetical protein